MVVAYDVLARSRIVRDFEAAFCKATGIWVKLVPAEPPEKMISGRGCVNPFCTLITGSVQGRAACLKSEAALQQRVHDDLAVHECRCFTGLSMVAIPVLVAGDHIGTLLAGQVFRKKPTRVDVTRLTRTLAAWGYNGELRTVKRAYLRTAVLTRERFHANLRLLGIFARSLAEYASRSLIAGDSVGPPCVASAKEFAQQHANERVTMRDAARHVHLSPFHFCKVFKKSTGMTYTECLSRIRVEKAKALLLNPFMRITEVAFSSGFQSIPHFNSVFKKYVSKSPTKYRESMRHEFAI